MDIIAPLRVTTDMKGGNYGMNRMLLNLQWIRKPVFTIDEKGNVNNVNRLLAKVPKFAFRSEMTLILDSELVKLAPTNKPYRFGVHNSLTWMPFVKSNVGVIVKHYYGRDYLNIRYDDVISSWQAGFTVDVNRY